MMPAAMTWPVGDEHAPGLPCHAPSLYTVTVLSSPGHWLIVISLSLTVSVEDLCCVWCRGRRARWVRWGVWRDHGGGVNVCARMRACVLIARVCGCRTAGRRGRAQTHISIRRWWRRCVLVCAHVGSLAPRAGWSVRAWLHVHVGVGCRVGARVEWRWVGVGGGAHSSTRVSVTRHSLRQR